MLGRKQLDLSKFLFALADTVGNRLPVFGRNENHHKSFIRNLLVGFELVVEHGPRVSIFQIIRCTMFSKIALLSVVVLASFALVSIGNTVTTTETSATTSKAEPTCCMKHAYCCVVKNSCCR